MDRIIEKTGKLLFLTLLLGVASCRDPVTDLLGKLEDDVKAANDLYLDIVSISPAENAQGFNPGEEIRIEFDRAVDMSTIEENFSLLDGEDNAFESEFAGKSLSFSFNETTNILTVAADPYLDGLISYKMELLDGIVGKDGSKLREARTVSFSTSDAPRGFVRVLEEYTNESTVDVEISSQGATYYLISNSASDLESSTDWQEITAGKMTVTGVPISTVEGTSTLYIKFRDGEASEAGSATKSNVEEATVIYDITPPVISFGDSAAYSKSNTSAALSATVTDSSGVNSYLWESSAADAITIADETSLATTAAKNADGSYTLRLNARDKAGNLASSYLPYIVDTVPPVINVPESFNTKSNTDLEIPVTVTDSAGVASYKWTVQSAPGAYSISSTTSDTPVVRVSSQSDYTLRVTVKDKCGNSNYRDVTIYCSDTKPTVKIPSSIYYENSSTSITADIAYNGSTPGTIIWTSDTGNVTFTPNGLATSSVTADPGTHKITCTVTSSSGSASASTTFIWMKPNQQSVPVLVFSMQISVIQNRRWLVLLLIMREVPE